MALGRVSGQFGARTEVLPQNSFHILVGPRCRGEWGWVEIQLNTGLGRIAGGGPVPRRGRRASIDPGRRDGLEGWDDALAQHGGGARAGTVCQDEVE